MADLFVYGNRAQLPKLLLQAPCEVSVEGRGTGKSFDIGFKMDAVIRYLPRGICTITGKTFGQLLTRTLPSSLKLLNQIGHQKDFDYVIGRKPPAGFLSSYEALSKFDNVISFRNGTRFVMISQSEPGSGRGANADYEIVDEALTIDREQYNNEVSPTNRGNNEFFGKKSGHPIPMHHGFKYSTSMPVTKEGRWVLEYADYYYKERGVRIFDIWNRVVMMQVDILKVVDEYKQLDAPQDAAVPCPTTPAAVAAAQGTAASGGRKAELIAEFRRQWNEIQRLKKQIAPFVSRSGVLFTLSNAFDNLEMLTWDYLLKNQKQLPALIFMVEIMNMYYDKVEDCFYSLQERKHVYYNFYDEDRLRGFASQVGFDFVNADFRSSVFDKDCEPSDPLELSFDWGSKICVMQVSQPRHWDFVNGCASEQICQTMINEFYSKPDGNDNVLIDDLLGQFCKYYEHHVCKEVVFFKDKYGDHRNPNVLNSKTYNEMALDVLRKHGWSVAIKEHKGTEPPQSDKYVMWGIILNEQDDNYPRFRINGDKCHYTLISMNNAKVKQVKNNLEKDKSSERPGSGVLPEEATHFSDAADKIMWIKYGKLLGKKSKGGGILRVGGRSF